MCGLGITFTYFLGTFALNNPNSEGWYGVVNDVATMNSEQYMTANNAKEMDFVHDHFVTWFLWGFINNIGILVPQILICLPFL